jgi:hypothetical protein
MAGQPELESYTELAKHCLFEADRTRDREVEQSLRALSDRFRRLSQRERKSPARGGPEFQLAPASSGCEHVNVGFQPRLRAGSPSQG